MASVDIPWPTSAMPGRMPGDSQGTLVNAYAVKLGQEIAIRRTAGLAPYLNILPATPKRIPRGQLDVNGNLLHAWDGELHIRKSNATDVKAIGALSGSDRVSMARNLRPSNANVVIVSEAFGAQLVDLTDDTIKPYPATGVSLAAVNSVEYYSGYFFFTQQNGLIYATDLQDTAIDPLSFALAEYAPDDLWRTKSVGSALAVMGSRSIEFWVDVAAYPFPLQRQTAIDVGLISPWAVAGGNNEWENGLLWVASDWTVRMLNGYRADIVSTDDVTRDIRRTADLGGELFAQVYVFNAQAIWSLTSPEWTWEFNLTSSSWHKRESYQRPNWRAAFACLYNGHWIAQEWGVNRLMEIDPDVYNEVGERLRWRVESAPIKQFPANFRIPSIDIDMTVGLGEAGKPSPTETDPAVMVSWSHDGGANWGNPLARSMGQEGRFANKVTVNNLGRSTSRGVMIRLDVVDPVWVQLKGAVSTRTKASRPRAVNQ